MSIPSISQWACRRGRSPDTVITTKPIMRLPPSKCSFSQGVNNNASPYTHTTHVWMCALCVRGCECMCVYSKVLMSGLYVRGGSVRRLEHIKDDGVRKAKLILFTEWQRLMVLSDLQVNWPNKVWELVKRLQTSLRWTVWSELMRIQMVLRTLRVKEKHPCWI